MGGNFLTPSTEWNYSGIDRAGTLKVSGGVALRFQSLTHRPLFSADTLVFCLRKLISPVSPLPCKNDRTVYHYS